MGDIRELSEKTPRLILSPTLLFLVSFEQFQTRKTQTNG
ncbi:hypothetical protein M595_2012 [Lyngbya aestuarii BL J]|uniref:Uncharacterized protein n=1 Tax=Lyngbya aestuarii BL J TaxID=1348334 RepID=U7QJC0_9CYAN|nr:hypothetical protein M595_2012 [Lyngbya aestuarii BL J]